jgi:hypothetical protein
MYFCLVAFPALNFVTVYCLLFGVLSCHMSFCTSLFFLLQYFFSPSWCYRSVRLLFNFLPYCFVSILAVFVFWMLLFGERTLL